VGRVFLSCDLFNFMGDAMKEHIELHNTINGFERFAINQDKEIQRLQAKIRGALAALQTGAALDVVAAIEILRGVK
jgi:uncharacterized protein (DUF934 family)